MQKEVRFDRLSGFVENVSFPKLATSNFTVIQTAKQKLIKPAKLFYLEATLLFQVRKPNAKWIAIFTLLLSVLSIMSFLLIGSCNDISLLSAEAYSNSQYGFSIIPPQGWEKADYSQYAVQFNGPENQGSSICYLAVEVNFNTSSTETLDSYYHLKLNNWRELQNFTIYSESNSTLAGNPSKQITYTCIERNYQIKNQGVLITQNNRGYALLYTALPEVFDKYLPAFNQSIQTLQAIEIDNSSQGPLMGDYKLEISGCIVLIFAVLTVFLMFRRRKKNPRTYTMYSSSGLGSITHVC